MARPSGSAPALIRRAGLSPEGPVPWGALPATEFPGVYVVTLPRAFEEAPLNASAIAGWRRRVGTVTVDGAAATQRTLMERLTAFWIPSATIVYIGQASGPVRGRVGDYYRTPLGDRSPHAGGYWLKTLRCMSQCAVWAAAADDYDDAEERLLDDFVRTVPLAERRALYDPTLILPFANLEDGRHVRKGHGIRGARLP